VPATEQEPGVDGPQQYQGNVVKRKLWVQRACEAQKRSSQGMQYTLVGSMESAFPVIITGSAPPDSAMVPRPV
jgi:hypothetical protein